MRVGGSYGRAGGSMSLSQEDTDKLAALLEAELVDVKQAKEREEDLEYNIMCGVKQIVAEAARDGEGKNGVSCSFRREI